MPYIIDGDGYLVWSDDPASPVITAEDGSGDQFSPLAVVGWSPSSESANIVHTLIDGSIAVTVIGDLPRAGELPLIFDNDSNAAAARTFLARPTAFTLNVPDRPAVNMRFVRDGALTAMIHDEARDVWQFSVGFQEVLP